MIVTKQVNKNVSNTHNVLIELLPFLKVEIGHIWYNNDNVQY